MILDKVGVNLVLHVKDFQQAGRRNKLAVKLAFSKPTSESAEGNGDVYGNFYEKQDPESDLVTLNCQPIKIGPSTACFLRGDEE